MILVIIDRFKNEQYSLRFIGATPVVSPVICCELSRSIDVSYGIRRVFCFLVLRTALPRSRSLVGDSCLPADFSGTPPVYGGRPQFDSRMKHDITNDTFDQLVAICKDSSVFKDTCLFLPVAVRDLPRADRMFVIIRGWRARKKSQAEGPILDARSGIVPTRGKAPLSVIWEIFSRRASASIFPRATCTVLVGLVSVAGREIPIIVPHEPVLLALLLLLLMLILPLLLTAGLRRLALSSADDDPVRSHWEAVFLLKILQ